MAKDFKIDTAEVALALRRRQGAKEKKKLRPLSAIEKILRRLKAKIVRFKASRFEKKIHSETCRLLLTMQPQKFFNGACSTFWCAESGKDVVVTQKIK